MRSNKTLQRTAAPLYTRALRENLFVTVAAERRFRRRSFSLVVRQLKTSTSTIVALLALLAIAPFVSSCGSQSEDAVSLGPIEPMIFTVTTGIRTPRTAGEYMLGAKNTTELHDAVAKLFLLDLLTNKYVVLEHKIGSVKAGAGFFAKWTLDRDNPVGKRWVVTTGGLFSNASDIDTNSPPIPRVFLQCREGTYEIPMLRHLLVIVTGANAVTKMDIEISPDTVYPLFKQAHVPLPLQ